MANNTTLNPVHPVADVARRSVAAPHRVMAFWRTTIGKKSVSVSTTYRSDCIWRTFDPPLSERPTS